MNTQAFFFFFNVLCNAFVFISFLCNPRFSEDLTNITYSLLIYAILDWFRACFQENSFIFSKKELPPLPTEVVVVFEISTYVDIRFTPNAVVV